MPGVYDVPVKTNNGQDSSLKAYEGKVLLAVNVASKCGLTPQYTGLEQVYNKYKDQGFSVVAFPANNFMGQEPGTDDEIKDFCSTKYNVLPSPFINTRTINKKYYSIQSIKYS